MQYVCSTFLEDEINVHDILSFDSDMTYDWLEVMWLHISRDLIWELWLVEVHMSVKSMTYMWLKVLWLYWLDRLIP